MEKEKPQEAAAEKIIAEIERRLEGKERPLIVALDGRSGVGKTTLSKIVGERLDATVILGDDFYSGGSNKEWAEKSAQEKADQGIDWRRIRKEVVEPLRAGRTARFHPFDWKRWEENHRSGSELSSDTIEAKPAKVVILDFAYSSRPELTDLIDLSVLVETDDGVRRERLKDREGESIMEEWHSVWDEAEDHYFKQVRPPGAFNLVVHTVNI